MRCSRGTMAVIRQPSLSRRAARWEVFRREPDGAFGCGLIAGGTVGPQQAAQHMQAIVQPEHSAGQRSAPKMISRLGWLDWAS